MNTTQRLRTIFIGIFLTALSIGQPAQTISGSLESGYRVLPVNSEQALEYFVHRGDYIKFSFSPNKAGISVKFPSLDYTNTITGKPETDPFFKMSSAGDYKFKLGSRSGIIHVLEYREPSYQEFTALEAHTFIDEHNPFILDVRTPREYAAGHLRNAVLVPVQELQSRVQELSKEKNNQILVYCHSGNRSTVASKILIDNGFMRIYNMRPGIRGWNQSGYPVEK